mmetsp:Transcript_1115/g.1600  ORF Transcript_1115/g.1600 Transcript_1115/m.1600 type:complete len:381 (-) Transcript_1115:189-1331(-)
MGASFSSDGSQDASITRVQSTTNNKKTSLKKNVTNAHDDEDYLPIKTNTRALQTPILMDDDADDDQDHEDLSSSSFPIPTGKEYDLMDKIASELPSVIDEESRQQVEDYIEACDKGKGPMVACFSTAEYLSLFLRKHADAEVLYRNTCFRPADDKSPNGVLVTDSVSNNRKRKKSKAYPPACFNLAQMRMTGKGGTKFDRTEGYHLFDRACRAGHGGSCHMQAKMLSSEPGSLGKNIPHSPLKASQLLQRVCDEGDSLSCFTLATMLLRGSHVSPEADNVTPMEARGEVEILERTNEESRKRKEEDTRQILQRDPARAKALLRMACDSRGHAPSCYNLAVMYTQGDEGVERDERLAEEYRKKTEEHVKKFGGFGFGGSMG